MDELYSRRTGAETPFLKKNEVSNRLTSKLWDACLPIVRPRKIRTKADAPSWPREVIDEVWVGLLAISRDRVPTGNGNGLESMRRNIAILTPARMFDFVEICLTLASGQSRDALVSTLNRHFSFEGSVHRVAGGQVVYGISPGETQEVERALSHREVIATHIDSALRLLYRTDPADCRGAVRESITAVEAAGRAIIGGSPTLGSTLQRLKNNGLVLHESLEEGVRQLYRYTNDAGQIRHAGSEGAVYPVSEREARLMVISCSAIVNFLMDTAESLGSLPLPSTG